MSDDAIPQGGPQLAAWVDRELQALGELESQVEDIHETARLRIRDFEQWEAGEVAKRSGDIAFRTARLAELARTFPYAGKAKSVNLPYGVIGTRVQPLSVEVKIPEKALDFAAMNELPINVSLTVSDPEIGALLVDFAHRQNIGDQVKEEARKDALLAFARERRAENPKWEPDWMDDGWQLNGGDSRPFVTPRKVEP